MSVILILLAASLSIAICFLAAFIWSVKNGQYEDDYTPSVRMLFEELPQPTKDQPVISGALPKTGKPRSGQKNTSFFSWTNTLLTNIINDKL